MSNEPINTSEIIKDAQNDFDLRAELTAVYEPESAPGHIGSANTIEVYTDREAGALLGTEPTKGVSIGGQVLVPDVPGTGIIGKLASLVEPNPVEQALAHTAYLQEKSDLEAEQAAIWEKLRSSAYVFTLRAIPPFIVEGCKRAAKADLEIKGKVPESLAEEFNKAKNLRILEAMTVSLESRKSGGLKTNFDYEDAKAIVELLPESEQERLFGKISETSFSAIVSKAALESADF